MAKLITLTAIPTTLLGALLTVTSVAIASPTAPNPFLGTWKLEVAKSRFSPGPGPKSQTRTYEESTDGMMTITVKSVTADGKAVTNLITFKANGKDYPVKNSSEADTVAERHINARTTRFTLKRAGKTVATGHSEVSRDGKTLRITESGTNGQRFKVTMVYEKE